MSSLPEKDLDTFTRIKFWGGSTFNLKTKEFCGDDYIAECSP